MQWAMRDVESVPKKFSHFFDENWPEKYFCQKTSQHAAQLNSVPTIIAKKLGISELTVKRGLKLYHLPPKTSEN